MKRPNEIIFSSSGLYGAAHIPTALLLKAAGGLKMRHLPTSGGGPGLTALIGNNAQMFIAPISASLAQIKAGKVRPLATLGATRSKALPDVPTLKKLGYGVEYYLWVGIFAPKNTPAGIVAYLRGAINTAAHRDSFKTSIANMGQDLAYLDQPEFQTFWEADARRIEEAVRQIGRTE